MRIRSWYHVVACMLAFLLGGASTFGDEKETLILGDWLTQGKDGIIQVYKTESGQYEGKVIGGSGDPNRRDVNNPDPNLRSRPLVGQVILRGFKYDGDGRWSRGTSYDPNNGKTYKSKLELPDASTLRVRGYIGAPIFGRTSTWTRHREDNQPKHLQ